MDVDNADIIIRKDIYPSLSFQSRITTDENDVRTSSYALGQLKELHMVNFMCHENFSIRFHPTAMQLITGSNGSGRKADFIKTID